MSKKESKENKSTSKIDKAGLDGKDNKLETKDTTKGHLNSKAPPVNYPTGPDISPVRLKEKATIKIKLDDKKQLEKALKLVKVLEEITALESAKATEATKFGQQIKAKETESLELQKAVGNRYEEKEVICDIVRNFGSGKREYWYQDVKYHEEPLRKSDHQYDLEHQEKANKTGKMEVVKEVNALAEYLKHNKLKAGDYVRTKKGNTVKLEEDDLITLDVTKLDRLATQAEIDQQVAADEFKKSKAYKK